MTIEEAKAEAVAEEARTATTMSEKIMWECFNVFGRFLNATSGIVKCENKITTNAFEFRHSLLVFWLLLDNGKHWFEN